MGEEGVEKRLRRGNQRKGEEGWMLGLEFPAGWFFDFVFLVVILDGSDSFSFICLVC